MHSSQPAQPVWEASLGGPQVALLGEDMRGIARPPRSMGRWGRLNLTSSHPEP